MSWCKTDVVCKKNTSALTVLPAKVLVVTATDRDSGSEKRNNLYYCAIAPLHHQRVAGCVVVQRRLSERLCYLSRMRRVCGSPLGKSHCSRVSIAAPSSVQSPPITIVCPCKILTKLVFHMPNLPNFPAYKPIISLGSNKKILRYRRRAIRD